MDWFSKCSSFSVVAVVLCVSASAWGSNDEKATALNSFETLAVGKKHFLIHGKIASRSLTTLDAICSGFERTTCNKRLKPYNDMRGALLTDHPTYRSSTYLGYPAMLENGEQVVLRVPRWQQVDHPFDASDFIYDAEDIARAEAFVDKELSPNIGIRASGFELMSGDVLLKLDYGSELPLIAVDDRLRFLERFVSAKDQERAFLALDQIALEPVGETSWSLSPADARHMPLYGKAVVGRTKQLNMVVNCQGAGGIRFNEVEVALADNITQPVYSRKFAHSEIDISSTNRGGVVEQAVVQVGTQETDLLGVLIDAPARISLRGQYAFEGALTLEQARQLRAVLDLYALIDSSTSDQLASK